MWLDAQLLGRRGCCFFSSRRRHTRYSGDWSSDVCSSDLTRPSSTARISSRIAMIAIREEIRAVEEGRVSREDNVLKRAPRSEERRVGKECGARGTAVPHKKDTPTTRQKEAVKQTAAQIDT